MTTLVSLGEYLSTTYEPDAEYVHGVIEERQPGEYDHSSWQGALLAWFHLHGAKWNVRARSELRVQVADENYRVPDVTVLDRSLPKEQIVTIPPVAVFEILSPPDTFGKLFDKLKNYERMGIRNILVIDPNGEEARFYRYAKGNLDLCPYALEQLAGTEAHLDWIKIGELVND